MAGLELIDRDELFLDRRADELMRHLSRHAKQRISRDEIKPPALLLASTADWEHVSDVPTAVLAALPLTAEATILVRGGALVGCNRAWQALCGYAPSECLGASPKILQGELTDGARARRFAEELGRYGFAASTLVNYTRGGRAFVHRIKGWALRVPADDTDDAHEEPASSTTPYFLTKGFEQEVWPSAFFTKARAAAAAAAFFSELECA